MITLKHGLIVSASFLIGTSCLAQDSKVTGKTTSVDLSTNELRSKWVKDWTKGLKLVLDNIPKEEAEKLATEATLQTTQLLFDAYDKFGESEAERKSDYFYRCFISSFLPPGVYLGLPFDPALPEMSFSVHWAASEGSTLTYIPLSAFIGSPRYPQVNKTPSPVSEPGPAQARIEAYKKWRSTWRGRLYGASMSSKGFAPIYDPVTGLEKWIPSNSINIMHY